MSSSKYFALVAALLSAACPPTEPNRMAPSCLDDDDGAAVLTEGEDDAGPATGWSGTQDCQTFREGEIDTDVRTEEAVVGSLAWDRRAIRMGPATLGTEDDLRCSNVSVEGIFTDLMGSFEMQSPTTCMSDAGETLYVEVDGFVDSAYARISVEIYNVPIRDDSGVPRRRSHCMIDLE
ncbi:MAG: hypothetical protein RL385_2452 [Pseudomonadota bacterium]|jgi:hypothetical protein